MYASHRSSACSFKNAPAPYLCGQRPLVVEMSMGITDMPARRRCIGLTILWPAFMSQKMVEDIDGRLKIIVMESEACSKRRSVAQRDRGTPWTINDCCCQKDPECSM